MNDETLPVQAEEPGVEEISSDKYSRRFAIGVALSVAAGIVGAAWYGGDRRGFGEIGLGGQNLALLPKIGQAAPDFVTENAADGQPVRLSDYIGRPVWLNFWGAWCPPCRSEMPDLVAAYDKLHPKGLELLAIALLEPAAASLEFAIRNNAKFTILSDPDRSDTGEAYPIANFPTHILIDSSGIIRDIILSAIDEEAIIEAANQIVGPETGS